MSILLELIESAAPAYKRKGSTITRYYRCTSGPKEGKLASDPGKCGLRPDPKRVRHGRKVARAKGAIRVRKTAVAKLQQVSKKITNLNRNIFNRRHPSSNHQNESWFLDANMLQEFNIFTLNINQCEQLIESADQFLATINESEDKILHVTIDDNTGKLVIN